ncbi:hypothetical protein VNO78_00571 [Psophocarpus tetragonolobus]|uniref:Uncharacterized protein n=1 Tax=Psophocarpus tetragonolobus TaxID=3891 RepID=A0AAN9SX90_PSOTE
MNETSIGAFRGGNNIGTTPTISHCISGNALPLITLVTTIMTPLSDSLLSCIEFKTLTSSLLPLPSPQPIDTSTHQHRHPRCPILLPLSTLVLASRDLFPLRSCLIRKNCSLSLACFFLFVLMLLV